LTEEDKDANHLFALQRHLRGNTVRQFLELQKREGIQTMPGLSMGTGNALSDLLHYSLHTRTRKTTQRQNRTIAIEERKRKEVEDRKKKRQLEVLKCVMDHREKFLSFHKETKTECSKVARMVKQQVESLAAKRERDEAKLEMKRLQALKENNMEEYMTLVKETKNNRLTFLLNETDNYLTTINRMIQEQRDAAGGGSAVAAVAEAAGMEDENMTKKAKDYYRSTHRTIEEVSQPRMLKGGDLKEYQLAGLQWLVSLYNNNLNGILADEMGLGKTIQTISLLSYLMEFKNNNGPFLVVVPLSTLSNWVNEFNKWAPSIIKIIYKGAPEQRKKIFKEDIESKMFNVLLTTYEYTMKDKSLLRRLTWQYIIVDEGHRMKNAQSKFAQTLGTIYSSKHRILLTGTPLQNNLPELWALLNFLLPSIFSSVDTFDQWFNKPFATFRTQANNQNNNDDGNSNAEENNLSQEERMLIVHRLHELLRPFVLRRVKDQVLDQMPQRIERVVKCPLSAMQLRMYHSIISKGLNGEGGLNNAIMQLKKVCNHPYLFLQDYYLDDYLVRAAGKFELLNRMLPKLKAAGHRVLLFSQMVEVMNILEQLCLAKGFKCLRLDGNTSSDERERRMFAFNDPASPYFIFLLSTRAGGLGLNLATADTVIIFDSDWNPSADAQAQGRAHRIGQKNEVRVFRILTHSPIEERIFSRATSKKNLTEIVVEAGKFNSRASTTVEENKEMMESLLNEYSASNQEFLARDFSDYGAYLEECDVPDNEELNEMMATYEGEYELYQQMDAESGEAADSKRNLLAVQELPPWMTEAVWPSKYSVLMNDVLHQNSSHHKKLKKRNAQDSGILDFEDGLEDDENMQIGPSGKLMRKRKDVTYSDGLTDLQFARMIEKQEDEKEREKHVQLQQFQRQGGPAIGGKKRSLADLDPLMQSIVRVVSDLQKVKSELGRPLYELFLEKPPKQIFPDYYQLIPHPISLKEIAQGLKKGEYEYFEQIELDLARMADNARLYNTEQSDVYGLCEALRAEFYKRCKPLLEDAGVILLSDSLGLGRNMQPPQLPLNGFDFYKNMRDFTGLLKFGGQQEGTDYNLDEMPKAKRGRTSQSTKGNTGLSIKLSLGGTAPGIKSAKKQKKAASSQAFQDDYLDDEDDEGLVFTIGGRR
jgi:SNF2 family DNA or RNA helicase